jgi:hypothetical protein
MKTYLEFGYVKMCRKRKKPPIAYMDKNKKTVKTSPDHKFQLRA